MGLALYRKYRPQTFAELTDQNHIKGILGQEVASGKVAHAYLFSGPRGTGKTSTARIFSKALNCTSRARGGEPCNACEACQAITEGKALDVLELDAASHTGVDNVRETIIETAKFAPSRLKYKIFIIDEAHMLSNSAWNALLKIMEEPPAHVIFILATTELHKVPETIFSRCQRFDFHRVHSKEMLARLEFIAGQEKIKVTKPVLETVARLSEGCVRDAESLLEQLFSLGEKEITEEVAAVVLPRTSWTQVLEFLEILYDRDARRGLALVEQLVSDGIDLTQFSADLIEVARKLLLTKVAGPESVAAGLDHDVTAKLTQYAQSMTDARILALIELLIKTKQALKSASIPQLPLEIAVVEGCGEAGTVADAPKIPSPLRPTPPVVADKKEGGGKEISLAEIKNKWPEVLTRAQAENHSLPFLLSTSEPVGVVGEVVQIGLHYPFHRDKLNEPKCKIVLEKIISDVYGMPLRVGGTLLAPEEAVPDSIGDILSALGGRVVD